MDSDRLNSEVLKLPEVMAILRQWWGDSVFTPDGQPDRRRVAEIVFADPGQRRRLEALLHALILERHATIITRVENHSAIKAIVIDSPLLLESNLDRECDTIVFVEASAARRVERLRDSRGWDAEELARRERWQASLDEKRSRAEFVVDNDGPAERLGPQVAGILQTIVARDPAAE